MASENQSVVPRAGWGNWRWLRAVVMALLIIATAQFVFQGLQSLYAGHFFICEDTFSPWPTRDELAGYWARNVLLAYLILGLLHLGHTCRPHHARNAIVYCCAVIVALLWSSGGGGLFGEWSIPVVAGGAGILMGTRLPAMRSAAFWATGIAIAALFAAAAAGPEIVPGGMTAGFVEAWAMLILMMSLPGLPQPLRAADKIVLVALLLAQLAASAYPNVGIYFGWLAYLCVIAFGVLAVTRFAKPTPERAV